MALFRPHRPAAAALAVLVLAGCNPQQGSPPPEAGPAQVSFVTMILRLFRVRPRHPADLSHRQPPGGPAAEGADLRFQTPTP